MAKGSILNSDGVIIAENIDIELYVNGIMKVPYYRETKEGDYGGEKSYVMAEMISTSMAQYCIQWNVDM